MKRVRDRLLEHIARRICARYNGGAAYDRNADAHFSQYLPAAEEALAGIKEFDAGEVCA